jgi:hypothetical protein
MRIAPAHGTAPAAAGSASLDKKADGSALGVKRHFVLAAAAVFVIFAMALGLRLVRNSSETSQPAATKAAQ